MSEFLFKDVPRDDETEFFCNPDCKHAAKFHSSEQNDPTMDHVEQYSRAVCYCGPMVLLHGDAIWEGDVPCMVNYWKHNLLQFLENNRQKYLIYTVQFLAAINDSVSEQLKEQLLWSRTVNQNGRYGNNISMDLMIEFLNKGCKGR